MSIFKKRVTETESTNEKDNGVLLPAAIIALLVMIVILLIVLLCNTVLLYGGRYDSTVFYVSGTDTPTIKNVQFTANGDGTYRARLYGILDMGNCEFVSLDRPSVYLSPNALLMAANDGNLPHIAAFFEPHMNAKNAGLQIGDILISLNDIPFTNEDWGMSDKIRYDVPNKFVVKRNGELLTYYVETDEDGKVGVTYGTSEILSGAVSFIFRVDNSDKYYISAVGHNIDGDTVGMYGTLINYYFEDNDSSALIPREVEANAVKSVSQDDYGIIYTIDTPEHGINDFAPLDTMEIAWEWEIDDSAPAYVLVPMNGLKDLNGKIISTPIPVNVEYYSGTIVDENGKANLTANYVLRSTDWDYSTSIDMLKDSHVNMTSDYTITETTPTKFLAGMSGCPVIQNDRLIGVLAAADVNNEHVAYMVSAQQLYLHDVDVIESLNTKEDK